MHLCRTGRIEWHKHETRQEGRDGVRRNAGIGGKDHAIPRQVAQCVVLDWLICDGRLGTAGARLSNLAVFNDRETYKLIHPP